MKARSVVTTLFVTLLGMGAPGGAALAQAQAQAPAQGAPADPWPRPIPITNAQALIYQPQIEAWTGNQVQIRAAVSINPAGAEAQIFGVIFATARAEVDRAARTVVFSEIDITKSNFPTLGDKATGYVRELKANYAASPRTISLDRVEASLKANGAQAPTFPVKNDPPVIIVSTSPAILVPISGAPVLKPVDSDTRFNRVINTQALILQGGIAQDFYLHVHDGWLSADALKGPWTQARRTPSGMDELALKLATSGTVDLLDGGPNANPKPLLANGVPTIYTSQMPTELIVFRGPPSFVPVAGTKLLWATNTGAYVVVDSTSSAYYVLLSGRWFRAPGTAGPWSHVASNALPADFSRIPVASPAGVVLASVAGTPQAQEAVIANSIPQTATVPRVNGPTFMPVFDGPPHFQPIAGTPLQYSVNSPIAVIRVDANHYYAVNSGVWFTAPTPTGRWVLATAVPSVMYSIPTSSSVYYVTYVSIYGSTPEVVYVGYTPGYMGTVVSPYGTVVYGTGYYYTPWVGAVYYPPPYTYGVAAVPVYNPALGFTYGFAVGLATAAWISPYYGNPYHPYPCCGSASANVYGQYGNTKYSGTRTAYATAGGTVGGTASGSFNNTATGTTGNYAGNRSYNPYTGTATRSGAVNATTAAGGTGSVAVGQTYNTYTGQKTTAGAATATGAGGSSVDYSGTTTSGPQGYNHSGSTTVYNANTGETNTRSSGSANNDHYADASGNVYKGSQSGGWQQQSASGSGWTKPTGDTSSMNREAAARSTGEQRAGSFSRSGGGGGRRR